jgi:N-terminal domain of anti-restriction factor ArdC
LATLAPATFAALLDQAVNEPGILSKAYSAFHGYSIGNQLLALVQCAERGIMPGPISTFVGWKERGRYVRKGERAIVLCMPVTCKRKATETKADDINTDGAETFTRFVYRPNWFVISQTAGMEVQPAPIAEWDRTRALQAFDITEEPFTVMDGNCQGYARGRTVAVSPVAELPHKTRFHELAHILLGHTSDAGNELSDSELTPRSLQEVEAEAVALVCLEALGLPGAAHCRGYIQAWNQRRSGEPIPERSAQRIFKAADQILRAGRNEEAA